MAILSVPANKGFLERKTCENFVNIDGHISLKKEVEWNIFYIWTVYYLYRRYINVKEATYQ